MLQGKTHQTEDTRLLSELRIGNEQAFAILYNRYWASVFDEAYRRLGNRDEAKDVAQEVFVSLWHRGRDTIIANLPAWLQVVVRNQVFKVFRSRRSLVSIGDMLVELEQHTEHADGKLLHRELMDAFQQMVEALPPQQRTVFQLRYQDELSTDEIAAKLHLSPKTVRNHLGRAIIRLKSGISLIYLLAILNP